MCKSSQPSCHYGSFLCSADAIARLYFTMMDRRKGAFSFNKDNLSPRYRGERAALRILSERS